MNPKGTIIFTSVGRPYYGFDIFSVSLPSIIAATTSWKEHRLTDGISVNFNGQFVDEDETLVYVSERTGYARVYLNQANSPKPKQLPSVADSLFHDRPIVKDGRLYFVSAHEPADKHLKSWSALYSTLLDHGKIERLTPYKAVDYSPSISQSEFHELDTDIVVFPESDPTQRTTICKRGGWPTWSGDSTIFFHRQADDGWWSIFRVDLPENFQLSGVCEAPRRVTPPGLHAFTPAASHDGKRIAVATRRRENSFRHIEIFDLELESFCRVTETLNPKFHHYNPFFSPKSGFLGYHRFRGKSASGDSIVPHLELVTSPVKELRMLRLNGSFPSCSPDGDLIAFNHDFDANAGIKIVRSDGSRRWSILKDRTAFYTSWNRTEKNVIYSSVGPIFESVKSTVQIARVTFNPKDMDDREDIPAEVKILTKEETGNNAFPSCSPDGKFVVFRSGRSGHKNLYIMDAVDGEFNGGIRQLTDGPWIDTMPNWSPDGKLIVFSSNRHNPSNVEAFSIYLIRPDGTDLRRVYVAGVEGSAEAERERINHVCFSPDSLWLVFTANLGGVLTEPVSMPNQFQPYGDLYVVRLDGSGLKRLTWNGYENGTPTWNSTTGEMDMDMDRLSVETVVGDRLMGQFDEPLWISCDM
uniref:Uncharacterized protein n=1 Tax=Nelumbo nucifera TaxID=4432 RepID=A0A822Z4S2_NELNU|nr:TPA_asm: hypothetical protein HUJ06_009040 [Nelumbo nucifera]